MADSEVYTSQLREKFQTFDKKGNGLLGKEALSELCKSLQFEEHTHLLLARLLGSRLHGKANFEDFKEAFISILKEADTNMHNDRTKSEVTPKYVFRGKTYGRRSKPDHFQNNGQDDKLEDITSLVGVIPNGNDSGRGVISPATHSKENEFYIKRRRKDIPQVKLNEDETFEAEGQMNCTSTDLDVDNGRGKLLEVWKSLGVGQDGYLTLPELKKVCAYIETEISDDEVMELFENLDTDHDGKVSFEELLNRLSRNSSGRPLTPSPRSLKNSHRSQGLIGTPALQALSAQRKLRLPSTPAERAERPVAPLILTSGDVTGLFSVLDPWHTGFAQPEDIIDLWEKHSIMNGAEILLNLGFDYNTKLNLSELSFALQQTLANENLDKVSQASLVTYQQELSHLRSESDALTSERDKLRLDLHEANARSVLLAKEVDERHAHMEKSNESKLLTIEKKYQDQIRALQGALESERETHNAHSAKLRQNLEVEMEGLKHHESKLKDDLNLAQEEMVRLRSECSKYADNLDEKNRQNVSLQQKLGVLEHLRKKISEYEQAGRVDEDQYDHESKIQTLEYANKDLKDKVDELTAELENLKQQLVSCKRKLRDSTSSQTKIPIKEGSVLSDYARQRRKSSLASLSSTETFEADDLTKSGIPRFSRSARRTSTNQSSLEEDSEGEHSLSNSQKLQLLERDQQKIEHSYRLEVSQLEDQHQAEKEQILSNFEKEKKKLKEDFEHVQQESLAEQQKELQNVFTLEKQDLLQKYESKKNLMAQEHAQEKELLLNRLKEEYEKDLDLRLGRIKEEYDKQRSRLGDQQNIDRSSIRDLENMCSTLEERLKTERQEAETARQSDFKKFEIEKTRLEQSHTKDREQLTQRMHAEYQQKVQLLQNQVPVKQSENSEIVITDLKQRVHDLELNLQLQREEIEIECERQKQELEERHQLRLQEMEARHQLKILDFENMIEQQGVDGLTGKLKDDFAALLEEQVEGLLARERHELQLKQREIIEELEQKQAEFEERKKNLHEKLMKKEKHLQEEYEELEKRKSEFEEESSKICDELETQETMLKRAHEQKRQEFEEARQQMQQTLDDQRDNLESQQKAVKQREEELEENYQRFLQKVQEKENYFEVESARLGAMLRDFENMKTEHEEVIKQQKSSADSDLHQRISEVEVQEAILGTRKKNIDAEIKEHQEMIQEVEVELRAEQKHLQTMKELFEKEKEESLDVIQKERMKLQEDQESFAIKQEDFDKECAVILQDMKYEKETLKNHQLDIAERQTSVHEDYASALVEINEQKDRLALAQKDLDEKRRLLKMEQNDAVQKLEAENADLNLLRKKLEKHAQDMDVKHASLINQVDELREEVESKKSSLEQLKEEYVGREMDLKEAYLTEKEKLCESYESDRMDLMEKYKDDISDLQVQLADTRRLLEEEKCRVQEVVEQEQLQRRFSNIREELKEDFSQKIVKLQDSFKGERTTLEERTHELEAEVEELQVELQAELLKRCHAEERLNNAINSSQDQLKQIEDLKQKLAEAQQEKDEVKNRLENRLDELLEKQEAMVKAEVELDTQQTLAREKEEIEERLKAAQSNIAKYIEEIQSLILERNELLDYKRAHSKLIQERDYLQAQVKELLQKLQETRSSSKQFTTDFEREKRDLAEKVSSYKDSVQDTKAAKRREEKEQEQAFHEEKKILERKLQKMSDKLWEVSAALNVAQSTHMKMVSQLIDCTKNMADREQFINLQLGLIQQQKHIHEFQLALKKELDLIEDLKETFKRRMQNLEVDKKEIQTKLDHSHKLFKEASQKTVKSNEMLSEKDLLIKRLHEDNSALDKRAKASEERQRHAEKRCLHLERKCASLQKTIDQACHKLDQSTLSHPVEF